MAGPGPAGAGLRTHQHDGRGPVPFGAGKIGGRTVKGFRRKSGSLPLDHPKIELTAVVEELIEQEPDTQRDEYPLAGAATAQRVARARVGGRGHLQQRQY